MIAQAKSQPDHNILPFKRANLVVLAKYHARELTASDYHAFRNLRLRALAEEGHFFSPSFSTESLLTDDQWVSRCTKTEDHCFFGLFKNSTLIGIMSASRYEPDESGQTALWGAAYIAPEYRGRKLGSKLYMAREEWTRSHPRYTRAIFTIIDGNSRSTEIHTKRGAAYLESKILEWPGRPPVLHHFFKKELFIDADKNYVTRPRHPVTILRPIEAPQNHLPLPCHP